MNFDLTDDQRAIQSTARDFLADRYKAKFNVDMNEHSALAYQTVLALKEAVEQAKSTDREKINDALHQLKIEPGPLMVMPSKVTFPAAAGTSPEMVRASVLLPAPLAPSTAVTEPRPTDRETSNRA